MVKMINVSCMFGHNKKKNGRNMSVPFNQMGCRDTKTACCWSLQSLKWSLMKNLQAVTHHGKKKT